jgi:hypothetical protein
MSRGEPPERALDVAAIGGLPLVSHDHLCVLYRGRAERDALLIPFLSEGIEAGHTCLAIMPEDQHDGLRAALAGGVEVPLLQLAGPGDTYLLTGELQRDPMLEFCAAWSREQFDEHDCVFARAIADMSWALDPAPPVSELVRFELGVTRWTRAFEQVSVCMYDLDRFGGDVVVPVIRAHPRVWLSGLVIENPYHLDALSGA